MSRPLTGKSEIVRRIAAARGWPVVDLPMTDLDTDRQELDAVTLPREPRETLCCWCPDDAPPRPFGWRTALLIALLAAMCLLSLRLTQAPACRTPDTAIPAHCVD